jgi:hypothetical protein
MAAFGADAYRPASQAASVVSGAWADDYDERLARAGLSAALHCGRSDATTPLRGRDGARSQADDILGPAGGDDGDYGLSGTMHGLNLGPGEVSTRLRLPLRSLRRLRRGGSRAGQLLWRARPGIAASGVGG